MSADNMTSRRAMGTRAMWTFVDQAVSSLTTAVLTILVARSVSDTDFGAFSTAFLVFSFVIGASRATITDPLVIRFSAAAAGDHAAATRRAVTAALLAGVLFALGTAVAGLLVGVDEPLGRALATLALVVPGMLFQDAWRYAFFSRGQAGRAAFSDTLWAVLQFGAIGVLFATGRVSVVTLMLSWGLAGLVAGVAAAVMARIALEPRGALPWVTQNRSLAWRLGADFIINMSAYNAASLSIAPIASIRAVGSINAARTLLGPLSLLFTGTTSFVLPLMVRQAVAGRLPRIVAATSIVSTVMTLAWSAVLFLMPDSWGIWLLGENWAGAASVLLPMVVGAVAVAAVMGPALGLKARAEGGRLLRTTVVQAPLLVVFGILGASWAGAVGAAWGFATAQVVGCAVMWGHFLASERQHRQVEPTPERQPQPQ